MAQMAHRKGLEGADGGSFQGIMLNSSWGN